MVISGSREWGGFERYIASADFQRLLGTIFKTVFAQTCAGPVTVGDHIDEEIHAPISLQALKNQIPSFGAYKDCPMGG